MPPDAWAVLAAGWIGQGCFFSRFFVQWWFSEKARRSVAPSSFWWLSALGAVLVGIYATARGEPVLLPGYLVTLCIALRNLWIAKRGESTARLSTLPAVGVGLAAALALYASGAFVPRAGLGDSRAWLAVGIAGQALWTARFLVQWWSVERAGKSYFPRSFWWISLLGNALLLPYAIHLRDAVFIAGFVPGPLVQARNLMLDRSAASAAP
jgi:lipid-A-disaccharide synthase-like uncharacterized protein